VDDHLIKKLEEERSKDFPERKWGMSWLNKWQSRWQE
jgi:hypothetical protein